MRTDTARAVHTPISLPAADSRESWAARALCRGPLASWWDDRLDGENETPEERRVRHGWAKAICRACPVQQLCRASVTKRDEGIWAGRLLTGTAGNPCAGCARPMVRSHRPLPAGSCRHARCGLCRPCYVARQRATA